jgi:hypothetical protein
MSSVPDHAGRRISPLRRRQCNATPESAAGKSNASGAGNRTHNHLYYV